MAVDDPVRKLIAAGANGPDIRAQAIANGMISMRRDGMVKAKEGVTTVEEVLRGVFFIG